MDLDYFKNMSLLEFFYTIAAFFIGLLVKTYFDWKYLPINITKTKAEADKSTADSAEALATAAQHIVTMYQNHFESELRRLRDEVKVLRDNSMEHTLIIKEQEKQIDILSVRLNEQAQAYNHVLFGVRILSGQLQRLGEEPLFKLAGDLPQ